MKLKHMTRWVSDSFSFRRRGAVDWILPASIGLGVGVIAGVAVGMLYAPEPGTETRRRLAEGADRLRDRARLAAEKARGELTTSLHRSGNEDRTFMSDVEATR